MKNLFSMLMLFVPFAAMAQSKVIEVLDPGTISLELTDEEKYTVTDLTVTGELNGTDILYIVEMAGTTVYHDSEKTPGQLKNLDLSGAHIVGGGEKYCKWPDCTTANNEIGTNMFKHTFLQNIVLPVDVVTIGENAFMDCPDLKSVTIPGTVTTIGSYAFNNCGSLESISIPSGVTAIKDATFMNCHNLKAVTLPENVETIGGNVFNGCALTTITLPANVKSLGYDVFCSSITEIHSKAVVPPTAIWGTFKSIKVAECPLYVPVGSVGSYSSAYQWSSFTSINEEEEEQPSTSIVVTVNTPGTLSTLISDDQKYTITELKIAGTINAEDLRFIREMAGSDENFKPTLGLLTSLDMADATIVADENLYYAIHPYSDPANPVYMTIWSTYMDANNMLPPMAFEGCHLENVVLPSSLVTIASAFCGCPLKGTIVIPEGVTHIRDYAFQGCSELEAVVLPSSLRNVGTEDPYYPNAIGAHVFEGCTKLSEINLPLGVTNIPANAFTGTGFAEFTIPATVQRIGSQAFSNMSSLTKIISENPVPPVAEFGAFNGVNCNVVKLEVPQGSEAAYMAADEWSAFFVSTGISMPTQQESVSDMYNIAGQKANNNAKGIVIKNGKKVVIK